MKIKRFGQLEVNESTVNEAVGKKIWIGTMPGAFGYGIMTIGETEDQVRNTMVKAFNDFKKSYKPPGADFKTFDTAMEYFGGRIQEVVMGKAYYDDFGE